MSNSTLVLLFYDGYERKARETLTSRAFHFLRCRARAAWRRLQGKQVETGFYVAFCALCDGLRQIGCEVRINDYATARAHPDYPIGIAGYPSVVLQVDLPNPVIFGPGDPGYPDAAGLWARQSKVKYVIQPSEWFIEYYRPYCGNKMLRCPVGIDTERIDDAATAEKLIDVLVYDKIRWYRDTLVETVRDRLIAKLDADGRSYRVLRYGEHTQESYFEALRSARTMAFLCEHETQGLACEEALAMNVPVFAWDEGLLVDPLQLPFAKPGLTVSSVPYFDPRCGRTFSLESLEAEFDLFWNNMAVYHPRDFVMEELSPTKVTKIYLEAYRHLIKHGHNQPVSAGV